MMWNNAFSSWGGIGFWFHVHIFFMLSVVTGILFLIILAAKHLKKDQITKWSAWLLAIGILGALLTSFAATLMWGSFSGMMRGDSDDKLKSGYTFGPSMMRWYLQAPEDK